MNQIILLGHVGKNPEVRHLDSGSDVATFSLATSDTYKKKDGEKVTNTEWHNLVVWGKLAEIAEKYVKKGSHLLVTGKQCHRSYDDKDGNKRYISEVVVRELKMLDKKSSSNAGTPSGSPEFVETEEVKDNIDNSSEPGDDLPF